MPAPTSDTALQRPDLGALVYEYMEKGPSMGYIGLEVMPIFETVEQSAQYPVMPKEALLKAPDTKRAMRGTYNRSDYEFEEGYYATSENGWEEAIDNRERKLYQTKFDADVVAAKRATGIILRGQEKRIADKVFNDSNFSANTITHEWDDASNAVPITDIKTGKMSVRSACGMLPNTLIIAYSTYENLKACDQIIDRLKYTFPMIDMEQMTTRELAKIFDIERVLVGGAVYDSAKKGQTASISDLWSNEYAMLTITGTGGDLTEPCIGRTFLWTEDSPGIVTTESYRDETRRSDIIRVRHDTDEAFIQSFDSSAAAKSTIYTAVSYLMDNITS
jgi:hypothetical protein